jgi:hypothetical protein
MLDGLVSTHPLLQWVETSLSNICKHLYTDICFYHLMVLREIKTLFDRIVVIYPPMHKRIFPIENE